MSVLLIAPAGPEGDAIVDLLVREDDTVGVIAPSDQKDAWRRRGAYAADSDPADPDLIYRSAQQARSIVVFEDHLRAPEAVVGAIVETAPSLPEAPRLLLIGRSPRAALLERLRASPLDFIVLGIGVKRLLDRRTRVTPGRLAEAVSAADDLGGNPRLELDLADTSAWSLLGL